MGRRPYRGQFLLIVLVTVVPLFVGWLGLAFLERRFIATAGEAVAVVAADIADSIDLFLVERYGDIQILADVVKLETQKGSGQVALFETVKRAYPSYLWIGVANADGWIVDALDPSTININVRGESWFQEAKKPDPSISGTCIPTSRPEEWLRSHLASRCLLGLFPVSPAPSSVSCRRGLGFRNWKKLLREGSGPFRRDGGPWGQWNIKFCGATARCSSTRTVRVRLT